MKNQSSASTVKVKPKDSIISNIIGIVVICIISVCAILLLLTASAMQNSLMELYGNYMTSTASNALTSIYSKVQFIGGENKLVDKIENDADDSKKQVQTVLDSSLKDISILGLNKSYVYYVSGNGVVIYDPDSSKIGQKLNIPQINEIIEQSGKKTDARDGASGTVIYSQNGTKYFAGYVISHNNNFVFCCAPINSMSGPVKKHILLEALATLVLSVLASVIIGFTIYRSLKPLKDATEYLIKTASLDFRHSKKRPKAFDSKKNDEISIILRCTQEMRSSLRHMIKEIHSSSILIDDNISKLQGTTTTVNNMCTDNSATSEELAAAMQQTSATTDNITSRVNEMKGQADDIYKLAANGTSMSDEIMKRASDLHENSVASANETDKKLDEVKATATKAIEDSKAVEKINELTESIMEINSQTSLLALNATIEAARAGEAGKGFAVVAEQISKLAAQTEDTVKNIEGIISEVDSAVKEMSDCIFSTNEFLENKIKPDYSHFTEVSDQYHTDADSFKQSMESIKTSISLLDKSAGDINDAVQSINHTVTDSANGISDIADKTTQMVGETSGSHELAEQCHEAVASLTESMAKFQIE